MGFFVDKCQKEAKMVTSNFDNLMILIEAEAIRRTDGHLSLCRFTTGWKAWFGTATLNNYEEDSKIVRQFPSFKTLREALVDLLESPHQI